MMGARARSRSGGPTLSCSTPTLATRSSLARPNATHRSARQPSRPRRHGSYVYSTYAATKLLEVPAPQLTDFEQVLLGLICMAPSSGYDLKRAFSTTPLGVYQPSSGALYPALA